MALKAGYYGIKKKILNQLLGLPADISDIRSEQAVLGAKNLLENKATSATTNGITFTVNLDGTVTVNGTATADAFLRVFDKVDTPVLSQGNYIISGGVPASTGLYFYLHERNAADTEWTTAYEDTTGNGIYYPRRNDYRYGVLIRVVNGKTINNLTVKPMIRLATDPDDTYAPYAMTNRELTEIVALPNSVFTLPEGVSITSNWSCICGRVLNIGLQLEFASAMSASSTVLTMPDYYLGNGKAGVTGMSILATRVSPQAGMYVFDIPAGSGPFKVRNVQAVAQGEKVCIAGTYIIK